MQHMLGALVETVAGGAFLTWIARTIAQGLMSHGWPQVEGTVKSSALDYSFGRGGPTYTPSVTYSYVVEGRAYDGKDIDVVGPQYTFERRGRRRLAPYGVGARVRVFYSPRRPNRAVLEPGIRLDEIPMLTVISVAMGFVFVYGLLGLVGRAT